MWRALRNAFDGGRLTATLGSAAGASRSRPKAREPLKVASYALQRGFPGLSPSRVRMRLPRGSVGCPSTGVLVVCLPGPAPGSGGVSLCEPGGVRRGGGAEGIVEQVIPWFH